jgi:hypothetical protein
MTQCFNSICALSEGQAALIRMGKEILTNTSLCRVCSISSMQIVKQKHIAPNLLQSIRDESTFFFIDFYK